MSSPSGPPGWPTARCSYLDQGHEDSTAQERTGTERMRCLKTEDKMLGGTDRKSCVCVCVYLSISICIYIYIYILKVTWHTAKYGDPYSEFVALHLPIQVHTTNTHREHTPGAVGSHLCCGAQGAVGGSVPCSRAPCLGIHSPHLQSWPRLKLATFQLRVRISNH